MEHLERSLKEKQANIRHAREVLRELEAKAVAYEIPSSEDASADGSDALPDSVTSSLTDSTPRSSASHDDLGPGASAPERRGRKRKEREPAAAAAAPAPTSSSDEDPHGGPPQDKTISFSSVSEMTDDFRSSSADETGGGGAGPDRAAPAAAAEGDRDRHSSAGSIPSTAAVVRGVGSPCRGGGEAGRQGARRGPSGGGSGGGGAGRAPRELFPIQERSGAASEGKEGAACAAAAGNKKKRRGFLYDYHEVFLKSNVPQLIATLSGSIVVCKLADDAEAFSVHKLPTSRLNMCSSMAPDSLPCRISMSLRRERILSQGDRSQLPRGQAPYYLRHGAIHRADTPLQDGGQGDGEFTKE